jgi:hypothetical protein
LAGFGRGTKNEERPRLSRAIVLGSSAFLVLGFIASIVDGVPFGKHTLVKNARNQNPLLVLAIEDNMPAALHSTQAGAHIVTASA